MRHQKKIGRILLTMLFMAGYGLVPLALNVHMQAAAAVVSGMLAYHNVNFADIKKNNKEIVSIINNIINERNHEKRESYRAELKSFPSGRVVKCWLEELEKTGSIRKKKEIIDNLALYDNRRSVLPVANYLISPHRNIRESAAKTLEKIGDDRLYPIILKMANSTNPVHRIYFIEAMNYLYDRRFYFSLINLLNDGNKSVRIYTINCLKKNMLSESLGNIRNVAAGDRNDEVRVSAIEAIGDFRDRASLHVLHRTVSDSNRDVRCESVKSIEKIGSAASVNTISAILISEEDNEIKELILDAMVSIGKVGNIQGLEKILLSDRNSRLRIKSAYALGIAKSQRAVDILLKGLEDSDYRVRAEASNSLGNYRGRNIVYSLLDVCEKESKIYVKSAALYAIKRINDKGAAIGLFDLYAKETDPIFKEMLRLVIRDYIERFI